MVSRRSFLKALAGGAVALSAGGIALLEAEPIIRTYFLPPRCGWNAGSWELACATEALRIVNEKLGAYVPGGGERLQLDRSQFELLTGYRQEALDSLLARRSRLVERVDKLARGWTPTRQHRVLYAADGSRFETTIHGGRS